ncbi:PLP-dependent transferase [Lophium mytilinum]|uniref:PLP-dependent transferase n=1 Tax=Lophium mytilinum TaxID=390894 RepID=A0A6A6R5J1_9PEZI|nr:PLP-dependent transferase [Lophium mytilinum]
MFREKLSELQKKRFSSKPLPSGPAPYTSSNHFKTRTSDFKPTARSWEHRFSRDALKQNASVLKAAAIVKAPDDTITLGTGRPAAEFYPWRSMAMRGVDESWRQRGGAEISCTTGENGYDLAVALNYGFAAGSPQLLRFVTEHVEMIRDPPYGDWECCLTCGTTSAIDLILQILCNRGDWILAEEYTYPGTIDATKSQGLKMLGVKMDAQGLIPDDLDLKLRAWDIASGKKPAVLYMIPTGHNPTGTTQSAERRKAIYRIAESHDLLIIEDDPYSFLQLETDASEPQADSSAQALVDRYMSQLPVSYLSLDASGRVIRLDSTSKVIAPGLRCGWMTACSQIVAKFLARTEVSTVSPSGVSQVMLYKLLDETWGHEGFLGWLRNLSAQYRQRRDILVEACVRYLPTSICSWVIPAEGMFLWVRVDLSKCAMMSPGYGRQEGPLPSSSIEDQILSQAKANGVLVNKGSLFRVDHIYPAEICFRLTFAAAPQGDLDRAVSRFGDAVSSVLELDSVSSLYSAVHEDPCIAASGATKNGCSARLSQKSGSKSCVS